MCTFLSLSWFNEHSLYFKTCPGIFVINLEITLRNLNQFFHILSNVRQGLFVTAFEILWTFIMVNIRRQRNGVQGQQHATYFESPAKNWRKTKTKAYNFLTVAWQTWQTSSTSSTWVKVVDSTLSVMGKFDVMVVSDIAVEEAETEAPLTLFGLIHPRTGKEVVCLHVFLWNYRLLDTSFRLIFLTLFW